MKEPKITVLMTVYNGGDYLKAAVGSILAQTFQDFEFLIVDDCSTDNSLRWIEALSDGRIRIHRNEINLGQTKSLNTGLRLAKGQYIARIDTDDIAFPSWLEQQLAFIKENPQYAVVSTRAAVMDGASRILRILNSPVSSHEIILKSLTASPINHVGSVYKKNIVLEHGGYDENLKIAADYELWSKLIRNGYSLVSTNHVSVAIRFHEQSISIIERGKRDIQEVSKIIYENIKFFTDFEIEEQEAQLLWKLIYHVELLDDDKFTETNKNLQDIYDHLKPSLGVSPALIKTAKQQQIRTIYMKKIFASVKNGTIKKVRSISRDYIQNQGVWNLFSIIWIFSFLGGIFLRYLPSVYVQFSRIGTRLKVRGLVSC